MTANRILAALCCLAISVVTALGATGRKISDYTETLTVSDAWIYEIAVPGVTNYKVTFGAMATNIIARVSVTGTNAAFTFDSTNDTLQILDVTGAYSGQVKINAQSMVQFANSTRLGFGVAGNTNWYINNNGGGDFGHWIPTLSNTYNVASSTQSVKRIWVNDVSLLGVTAARPLFLNSSGNLTNASGTPDGTKFVRDDGVLAVPPGAGGEVTTAQLNTASNAVVTLSSNNVRVAAGTGTTVSSAGAGGVQTFTVNASGGVSATNANQFGANTTLTIKDGALFTNTIVYGSVVIAADNSVLKGFRFGTTSRPDLVWADTNGTVGVASNLFVTNAISASSLSVISFFANSMTLTNALGSNQVRMGINDLTNSVAVSPTDGQLLAWDSGMKKWTNRTPDSFASTTQMVAGAIGTLHVTNKVGIGVIPTNSTLEVLPAITGAEYFRVNETNGARRLTAGVLPGFTQYGTIWLGDVTPSAVNYAIVSDGSAMQLNGASIVFNVAGSPMWQITGAGDLVPGSASVRNIGTSATRPKDLLLSGSIATARSNLVASASIGIGVSGTNWTNSAVFTSLTNNVTVYIDASTVTTVATIGKNGQQIAASIEASMATVNLKPNEYVTISYSGTAPTARWESW